MSPIQWKRAHHHSSQRGRRIALVFCVLTLLLAAVPPLPASARTARPGTAETPKTIPLNQLGATADQQLTDQQPGIRPTATGAAIQAVLQDLAGDLTPQGLWLHSTAEDDPASHPFRIKAAALGRGVAVARPFAENGPVQVSDNLARWLRPGVVEEYSTSTDGVRQDFLLNERPAGREPLRLELAVTGAQVMPAQGADNSVTLVLAGSGRQLVYHQLHVTDADGRTLPAQMTANTIGSITLLVQDQSARWPLRIDPTFSDADWSALGSDVNGSVKALAIMGSDLYVGGFFTNAGGVSANNIARWNGSSWSTLGAGVNGDVYALAVLGSDLYVGGYFTTAGGVSANHIARWNGSTWSPLGSGTNFSVYALAVSGSDLYVGGRFTTAGGVSANHIARWNGTTNSWSALGTGIGGSSSPVVFALAVMGSDLYVGGYFTTAGGANTNSIARWNGASWYPLSLGVDDTVFALATNGSDLYVGGYFPTVGGVNINHIAKWNGSTWSPLGSGTNSSVYALAVSGSDLYVGGRFTTAGGVSANHIARWNGSAWSPLGNGVTSWVGALAVSGSDLYVGGAFLIAGGMEVAAIARWNSGAWSALGAGVDSIYSPVAVTALAVKGKDLYVGGGFTSAGGVAANNIARWNGNRWFALGAGVNDTVWALAVLGSDLYVGGNFTTAGGASNNHIAKWNGSAWAPLAAGVNGSVFALATNGSNLYVGGQFTTVGGVSANHLAQWNGATWSLVGPAASNGVNGDVYALAVSGSDLYVGGPFTMVGGINANRVAKWNGSSWSPLGSGMDAAVWALAVSGGDLYAGGQFTMAGGGSANRIAKWDGWGWSALGAGVDSTVEALALNGIDLYVGGQFTTAGGVSANRIAKWDGSVWSPLGSGANGKVSALKVSGGDLFVGGYFDMAGGLVARRIAKARIGLPVDARITIRLDSQPDNEHNSKFTTSSLGTFYLDDINNTKDAYTRTKSFVVNAGSYTFTETPPSGWHVDSIVCSNGASTLTARSITVTVADGDNITCTFTDKRTATLTVIAFNDRNGNGVKNASEPTQDGWTMQLGATGVPTITKITASANVTQTGRAVFTNLKPGLYRLCEVAQAGWTITRPTPATAGYSCYQSVTLTAGVGVVYSFGNRAATVAAAATDDALSATDGPVLSYDLPATDDDGNEIGEAMPLLSLDAETPIAPALPVASDQLSFSTFLPLVVAGRDSTLAEDVPVTQEVLHLGAETNSGDTENAGTIDLLPTQEERQDSAAPTSTTGADGSLPAHTLFLPLVTQ